MIKIFTDLAAKINLGIKKPSCIILACLLLISSYRINAQQKVNYHEKQIWIGYMTSVKLNERFSLWNDFHFATSNFLIGRHGVSYHFNRQVTATGGYAWLFLAPSFSNKLLRQEHRPWAQLMVTSLIGTGWQVQQRIRYDARFREKVENDKIIGGVYTFNHRVRFMYNIRKTLNSSFFGSKTTFISLNNEVLVNFGRHVYRNHLDQFRTSLLIGRTLDNKIFQLGYMYRFIPLSTENTYRHYHSITLWINHNFRTKAGNEDLIR